MSSQMEDQPHHRRKAAGRAKDPNDRAPGARAASGELRVSAGKSASGRAVPEVVVAEAGLRRGAAPRSADDAGARAPSGGPPVDSEGWEIASSSMLNPEREDEEGGQPNRGGEGEGEAIMVTATLVPTQEEEEDGFQGPGPEEPELVAVAKKVSRGHCYIWGRDVHWGYIATVIALLVAAVAVAATLASRGRNGGNVPPKESIDPEELGICGGGKRRNGTCADDGHCCSPFGYCGTSPDHCVESDIPDHGQGQVYNNTNATIGPISTDKICGGYYPDWIGIPPIRGIHPNYNLIYLFAARQNGATDGSVSFLPPYEIEEFRSDVQNERTERNRTFMLSVGGFGHSFPIPDRAFSRKFVESVSEIYEEIGGFDGLDWGIFADGVEPSTEEMIWIGLELRRLYPGFVLSSVAVPYRPVDKEFCREAVIAGALDYCTPTFYGGPDLNVPSSILAYVREWTDLVGEEHLVVGLGVNYDEGNFQILSQAIETYNKTKALFPDIRGVTNWHVSYDHQQKTGFAVRVCTV